MRQLFLSLLALATTTLSFSQKTIYDEFATRRSVESFHGIEASAGIEVLISQSDKEDLAISTNLKEIESRIVTKVEDGILKIGIDADWKLWKLPKTWRIKVYVSYKEVDMLKAQSGASIHGDVNVPSLRSRLSSGGIISLEGKVENLIVEGSSGAIFKGYNLSTGFLDADVSSGAGVQVTATKEVNAEASSGGYVTFKGDAIIRSINVNSGGAVRRSKD